MNILALIADREQEHLRQGYEPAVAKSSAVQVAVYLTLDAAGLLGCNVHDYWSSDIDYHVDFWDMPSDRVWQRLGEAAKALKSATGVTVYLEDCSGC